MRVGSLVISILPTMKGDYMLPSPTLEGQHAIPTDVLNDAKGSKKRRGVFFGGCEKDQVIIIDLYSIYIYI